MHENRRLDAAPAPGQAQPVLYRLNSNQSTSSIFEDVEMAHEEVSYRAAQDVLAPQVPSLNKL